MGKEHKMRVFVFALALAGVSTAALAQDLKVNPRQPIEVTADTLEVSQHDEVAVFVGNVVAVQGDMRLTSDRMEVFYRTGEKAEGGEKQPISKIHVKGNVLMKSPQETARAREGVYNVDKNVLTLHNDVVLTRGENVVKGQGLEYNLTTGKSKVTGGVANSASSGSEKGTQGRVRGLFVPGKE